MSVRQLIEHFSHRTLVPVSPNDVRDKILEMGISDKIRFVPLPFNSQSLIGMHLCEVRRNGVYAEPEICVDVCYDSFLPTAWQRLVCCTELLHIFDSASEKTSSQEKVVKLIEDLASGTSRNPGYESWGLDAFIDRVTVFRAVTILFPLATRAEFLPAVRAGKLTVQQVSEYVDLPEGYTAAVFEDAWLQIHDTVLKSC